MPFDLGFPPSAFNSPRPGYNGTSLQEAAVHFSTEDKCFDHILRQRFGAEIECSKCEKPGRWHRRSGAKCIQHNCGAVISPLAGTMFHATKLPLRLWFYAMLHFANSPEGVNAGFLARQLGITYPAAFRMAQKIRCHMAKLEEFAEPEPQKQNVYARLETLHRVRCGPRSRNTANVLFVASQSRVDCTVVVDPRRHSLRSAITKLMPMEMNLITTCYRTSNILSTYGQRKPLAKFMPSFFLDNPAERDLISGFLSYFLVPFKIHHKHASQENFWLYLKEFQFRYNRRHRSGEIYWDMVNRFPSLRTSKSPQLA